MIFRKSFIASLVLILFCVVASPVYATETNIKTRDQIREELQEKREALVQIREEVQQKRTETREEFRERLAGLQDQRKAALVSRLSERVDTVNEKWVMTWSAALDRMTELLAKVETRTATLEGEGYNVVEVKTAIEVAKVSLADAKTALDAQAVKDYTITITDEPNLRNDVSEVVKQLRADLQIVRDEINQARADIRSAIELLTEIVQTENE